MGPPWGGVCVGLIQTTGVDMWDFFWYNFIVFALDITGNLLRLLKSLGPVVQRLSWSIVEDFLISTINAVVNIQNEECR